MRIAVISDTHGMNKDVIEALASIDKPDMLIHLGDYVDDGEKISKILGIPVTIVKGNGDPHSNYNEDELIEIDGKKLFLTHGHRHNVVRNLDTLYYKALEMGADLALFGHTHVPVNLVYDDIIIMNPGSPSLPRSDSFTKTFGLIDIGEKINTEIRKII
ncbi:MAG: metallophosphoesterase [Tissierella sp.]|nr:metallophosphoesterase [Tissierella sp.]